MDFISVNNLFSAVFNLYSRILHAFYLIGNAASTAFRDNGDIPVENITRKDYCATTEGSAG